MKKFFVLFLFFLSSCSYGYKSRLSEFSLAGDICYNLGFAGKIQGKDGELEMFEICQKSVVSTLIYDKSY